MASPSNSDHASRPPDARSAAETDKANKIGGEDLDLDWDSDEDRDGYKHWIADDLWPAIRSAILIHLIDSGLPKTQQWIFYLLLVQFHEVLYRPLYAYSLLLTCMIWYFPKFSPLWALNATRWIDGILRNNNKTKNQLLKMFITFVVYLASSTLLSLFTHFRGMTEVFESLFGPSETWPAALLPIVPGMFLRSVDVRPCSINGFVPEGKQGILMAIFIRACTAVLPSYIQWGLWTAYAAPSDEYPFMYVEFLFCTFCWRYFETPLHASYAIYLLVNQYQHPLTWFRDHGGGPSVILKRERRGLIWFITTSVILSLIGKEAGPSIIESHSLDLSPQLWIPLALILTIGIYLIRYGMVMRIYRYKHQPLEKRGGIRLLRLRAQSCRPNAPIQCDIVHTTLQDPPPYIAVSHRWGEPGERQEMILIDGGLFPVSISIYTLLLAKRSNFHHRLFWIDSICINQDDTGEKSRQVGMMRRIFEEAELTLGWLGDDPGAKKAFALIARINETTSDHTYATLRSEIDSGWTELEKMISNSWFERVWIIQEIAVAKAQILRYGSQEIEWKKFARALWIIMYFSFKSGEANQFVESNELLSALVMEDLRSRVEDVDYLKLKDIMKLSLRFKATLPVDKVYAMLGIVDERYTPLFHPKFASNDLLDGGILRLDMILKDIAVVIRTIRAMQQALDRSESMFQSRRGRALRSSTDNGVRQLKLLFRDMGKLVDKLKQITHGDLESETEPIRPDYSENTTPQLVYTYVARDHAKQGDAFSFIGLAGIGLNRNDKLTELPSWVPDWSTGLGVYVLPQFQSLKVESSETTTSQENDHKEPIFRDGGSKFLFIQASVIGIITHTVALSKDFSNNSPGSRDEAEKDFVRLSSSFEVALALAHQHLKSSYEPSEFLDAFHRTLVAGSSTYGIQTNFSVLATGKVPGIYGKPESCQISAALWPEKFTDYWSKIPSSDNPEVVKAHQTDTCKKYLHIRRMQSSANSKFTHLVRSEVAPSFSQYRERRSSDTVKKSPFSMLDDEPGSAASGYGQYVDYAIGRQFAILDSGFMGLVPSGSDKGDVVVQIQSGDRMMWLALRQEDLPGQNLENITRADQDGSTSQRQSEQSRVEGHKIPSVYKTFRLVGESYIHYPSTENRESVEERSWFRLW